jgi:hypothetical protein
MKEDAEQTHKDSKSDSDVPGEIRTHTAYRKKHCRGLALCSSLAAWLPGRGLGGPRSRSGRGVVEEEKYHHCLCGELKPGCPARS